MLYAIAAVLVLILDQGLKYYVTLNITLNEGAVTLIPNVLSLVNIHNSGAAFSILSGGGARWAFVILAVVLTVGVVYAIAAGKVKSPVMRWLLVFIAAGAVGNAIDRALYGYVVDMFRTDFMNFAVFNVADIFITCGCILLCICILIPTKEERAVRAEKKAAKESAAAHAPVQEAAAQEKPKTVLVSRKKEPSPEIQERRRTGKLYDDPAPYDKDDPFGEFTAPEQPAQAPAAESAPETVQTPVIKDLSVEEQLRNLSVDDILKEFH